MGQFESFIGVNFWTALFVLLNTLAVFFVAKHFLFAPVHRMITRRQEEIDGMYADAGKAKSDAEAMAAECRRKLSDAQSTSERLVKEAAMRSIVRSEEILRDAQAEASAIRAKAEKDAIWEKKIALLNAKNEISSMAVEIAEKVIGRELNESDQADLVNQFIEQLGGEQ